MNYEQFYDRNGIDYSKTRVVINSNEKEAKNRSHEICWGGLSEAMAKANALIEHFKVDDKTAFLIKFNEVIGGDGRITTLHSSALLALMCFWRIDDNHPICIKKIEYTKVFFECPNRVIDGRKPSNIDVALVSKDKKNILLLESKFTEFYSGGKVTIPAAYRSYYKELVKLWKDSITMTNTDRDGIILTEKNIERGKREYLAGIKQMVSHLIGALRGPKNTRAHEEYKKAYENASKIMLGTILYKPLSKKDDEKGKKYIELYKECFGKIGSEILTTVSGVLNNKNGENKDITILPEPLFYQDILLKSTLLLEEVRKTYFSNK